MPDEDTRSLWEKMQQQLGEIRALRPLEQTDQSIEMPIGFYGGVSHQPIDPMHFKLGEWAETPWEGVRCFGVSMTEDEVVVVCEIDRPIRCEPQEHGPWTESLVMMDGELYEHTTGETFRRGFGHYYQPAGQIHEPEFFEPARCVITWRKAE